MEDRAVAQVLRQLLEHVDVFGELVAGELVAGWPPGVQERLEGMGVLVRTSNARGLSRTGCEEACWVLPEVRVVRGESRLVHFCAVREDIGYVDLDFLRLKSWRLDAGALASTVGRSVGFAEPVERVPGQLWLLGESSRGRVFFSWKLGRGTDAAMVQDEDMLLVAGHHALAVTPKGIPLSEVLGVEGGAITLPSAAQRRLGVTRRRPGLRTFPTPPGKSWEHLVIRVVDDEHIEIQVGEHTETRSYAQAGMSDTRKVPPEPKRTWTLLLLFAKERGELGWGDEGAADWIKAQMKELRQHLRALTGLAGNPFHTYKSRGRWEAKFTITDLR